MEASDQVCLPPRLWPSSARSRSLSSRLSSRQSRSRTSSRKCHNRLTAGELLVEKRCTVLGRSWDSYRPGGGRFRSPPRMPFSFAAFTADENGLQLVLSSCGEAAQKTYMEESRRIYGVNQLRRTKKRRLANFFEQPWIRDVERLKDWEKKRKNRASPFQTDLKKPSSSEAMAPTPPEILGTNHTTKVMINGGDGFWVDSGGGTTLRLVEKVAGREGWV